MWKVSQIFKVRVRSLGMGPNSIYTSEWWRRVHSHKRGACLWLPATNWPRFPWGAGQADSRFHKTSSNSSASQPKQMPHQYLTFLKITTTKTSRRNKNFLREENYSPCSITTTTSASPYQQIWAERAGTPQKCCTYAFVEVNAPQSHNVVQLEETCSSGSQICPVMELCLLNKFYSEFQHIKDNVINQFRVKLNFMDCNTPRENTVQHLHFRLQKMRTRVLKWTIQTHAKPWAERRLKVQIFWILCGSLFLYLAELSAARLTPLWAPSTSPLGWFLYPKSSWPNSTPQLPILWHCLMT